MGFRIVWKDNNSSETGHHVYRSLTPMDPENLPPPIATLGPDATFYEDGDVTEGLTYYYRVGAFNAAREVVSEELEAPADPNASQARIVWRILIQDTRSGDNFACWVSQIQMRVLGGPNLAVGGSAYASSFYSTPENWGPGQAFDGSASTGWSCDSGAPLPQWIAYQLTSPAALTEISIQAGNNAGRAARAPRTFQIQSSMDGTIWETRFTATDEPAWDPGEIRTYTF
ncbi:virion structural protein [Bordetella phage MW2]|uniref:Putative virion structural protein n=1 Tax=Bordetella phage MW2 TaxID=1916126 RepID=A0A2D0W978_9CAUD|nr:virion structural protein [Bordetella phage MW2]APL99217.1 putative virion structural protein [Bordetella phage MW2]